MEEFVDWVKKLECCDTTIKMWTQAAGFCQLDVYPCINNMDKEIFVLTFSLFNMRPCEKLQQKELEGNFYSCNAESWAQSSQLTTTGAEWSANNVRVVHPPTMQKWKTGGECSDVDPTTFHFALQGKLVARGGIYCTFTYPWNSILQYVQI